MSPVPEAKQALVFPKWFLKKTLPEVRQVCLESGLKASLNEEMSDVENRLVSVCLEGEQHFPKLGFSVLVLTFEFESVCGGVPNKIECVIEYPFDGKGWSRGAIRHWFYPNDPKLPLLSDLVSKPNFIGKIHWDFTPQDFFRRDEEVHLQRLLYNPNRRATFLLSSPKSGKQFILKMVRGEDFDDFFCKADAIRKSRLPERLSLPNLLASSKKEGLFLYSYISGLQIKKLKGPLGSEVRPLLYSEVARILAMVHSTSIPSLKSWDHGKEEILQLRSLLCALRSHHGEIQQEGADKLLTFVEDLSNRFEQQDDSPCEGIIHNSFSEKHILFESDGLPSRGPGRFGVLDWDSAVLGPKEKDIGQFLSGLTNQLEEGEGFIRRYESETGNTVNRTLVQDFIVYRRLLKLIHKGLKRNDLDEAYLKELEKLTA